MKSGKDLSHTKEYQEVLRRIKKLRKERGIKTEDLKCRDNSFNPSCYSFGEAYNLVEVKLIPCHESFHPTWKSLQENFFLIELAYNYLVYNSREGLKR